MIYRKGKRIRYKGFYKVSNFGRVKSKARIVIDSLGRPQSIKGRILKPGKDQGYLLVAISKGGIARTYHIQKLVLWTFVGPCPEGLERCHKDDNRSNNRLDNLYYGTHKQNYRDAIRNGVLPTGEKNGSSKLNEETVRLIRSLYKPEWGILTKLGKQFGIDSHTVSQIVRRITWKNIDS